MAEEAIAAVAVVTAAVVADKDYDSGNLKLVAAIFKNLNVNYYSICLSLNIVIYMKRSIFLAVTAFMVAASTNAQNIVNAVHIGTESISGTARYRSMAGAFGALGGDPSVMTDNPAGLAIYRGTNVLTVTPHWGFTGTKSKGTEEATNKDNNFALSNLSAIFSYRTPNSDNLVNFTFGLSIDRQYENNSKYNTIIDGGSSFGEYLTNQANNYLGGTLSPSTAFDWYNEGTTAPFLTMLAYDQFAVVDDPFNPHAVLNPVKVYKENNKEPYIPYKRLYVNEETRLDHYNISGAFNINDIFYLGATMSISDYRSIQRTEFCEDYDYDYMGSFVDYNNDVEFKGSGIGFQAGVIWSPFDSWRIGASVHTPTWTTIDEYYIGSMLTDDERVDDWTDFSDSWRYEFSTPWEYQFSAAYIFGTRGLLSFEYDMRDFTTMEYSHNRSYGLTDNFFNGANDCIDRYLQAQHTFKVGSEYRITPNLSARLGYAFSTSPYTDEALYGNIAAADINQCYYETTKINYQTLGNQYYITGGLGWTGTNWYVDAAFMYHHSKYHAAAYPGDFAPTEPIDVNFGEKNFDVTIGYRF